MLNSIQASGGVEKIGEFITQVKDKNSNVRLMGFGHRVYKNFDPRAKLMRETCITAGTWQLIRYQSIRPLHHDFQ